MKLAGQSVTYLATTAPAVGVLEKDGFEVDTVARFLVDEKMQEAAEGAASSSMKPRCSATRTPSSCSGSADGST